jgi:signal transduction histidine kinase/phage shock protein PspC (stress-responsive transcriptional regulator)
MDDRPGAGIMVTMAAAAQTPSARPRRYRYPERGLLGGVCAGLAEHLAVDVRVVRVLTALTFVAGGVGIALYVLFWGLTPVAPGSEGARRPKGAWREAALIVLGVFGVLALMHHTGFGLDGRVLMPLVLGACGMALVWRPAVAHRDASAGAQRLSWRGYLRGRGGRIDLPRLTVGGLLVVFASAATLHYVGALHSLGEAIGAVAVVALALGLLVAPWFVRLARNLSSERAARIREQERAEVAAHLHDSVLQTLALIQRRAGDPREVAGLARRQERELRRWLFERPQGAAGESARGALERVAGEVEELHGVAVEAVLVGDRQPSPALEALVAAAREALVNAAKFAGVQHVDLYAEMDADGVEAFVRDRGCGFDPDAIPEDRRGVRDSIVGRVERHGGQATVSSTPGEGTEVRLRIGPGRE